MPALIWYFIIGYALASFVNCSYTNSAFDKYFNSRIEGAQVGQGMRKAEEDEFDDDEEEAERKASWASRVTGRNRKMEGYDDLDPDRGEDKK